MLKPDRWRRIEQLYHAALARDLDTCAAFLRDACADEVLQLGCRAGRPLPDAQGQ